MLIFAEFTRQQNEAIKILQAKQEAVDTKSRYMRALNSSTCCPIGNMALGDIRLNTTAPPTEFNLNQIFDDCSGTRPIIAGLSVKRVRVVDIRQSISNPNAFTGTLSVDTTPVSSSFVLQPITVSLGFTTDPTDPPNNQRITSCYATGSPNDARIQKFDTTIQIIGRDYRGDHESCHVSFTFPPELGCANIPHYGINLGQNGSDGECWNAIDNIYVNHIQNTCQKNLLSRRYIVVNANTRTVQIYTGQ